VVLEISGKTLWEALEASFSTWPAQEGRFPVIAGFRVSWDSRHPPGQRVLGVWLLEDQDDDVSVVSNDSGFSTPAQKDGEAISPDDTKPKYKILTREYMAQGHDGFTPLGGNKYLIDDESGQITSTVVRKYLLGSRFVRRLARFNESQDHLHGETHRVIESERSRLKRHTVAAEHWRKLASVVHSSRSWKHFRDYIHITSREHMTVVDCFDGAKQRAGKRLDETGAVGELSDEDLLVVNPTIDGRLRDKARN